MNRRQKIIGAPVPQEKSGRHLETPAGLTVEQLLTACVLDLKKIAPFFYAAVCVVPRIESNEVADIAVSPDKLYYNAEFIARLERPVLSFFLIHDLYHIVMRHHQRGKGKDPEKWNEACDLYINACIAKAYDLRPGADPKLQEGPGGQKAFLRMPASEYFDPYIDISKATPEQIYRELPDFKRKEEQGEGKRKLDKRKPDIIDDAANMNAVETSENQKSERILKKIQTTYDQMMRTVAGHDKAYEKVIAVTVDRELAPKVNWRALLQNRLVSMKLDEKSLSYPDRRFVHTGLYVEGEVVEEEELSDIKICVDTSGSMSDEEVALALHQIGRLLRQYHTKADLV